ncbi:MAG TPA: hypothetical protein VJA25_08820 [Dehalococcoidia bacterium]|nr:hypothetical protein [Dehalococcoidia bacterium]
MNRAKRLALVGGFGLVAVVFLYAALTGGYGYGYYRVAYFVLGGAAGYASYRFYKSGKAA